VCRRTDCTVVDHGGLVLTCVCFESTFLPGSNSKQEISAMANRSFQEKQSDSYQNSGYPTPDGLFSTMQGASATNEWDIVCSYNEEKFNALLKTNFQAGKLVTNISFSVPHTSFFDNTTYIIDFNLSLGSPALEFLENNMVILTMPLEKASFTTRKKGASKGNTNTIPANSFNLTATVPLAAMNGDTREIKQGVIEFTLGSTNEVQHIFLHFNAKPDGNVQATTYRIAPADPSAPQTNGDLQQLEQFALPQIKEYFENNAKAFEYALTAVSNKPATQGEIILKPKAFVFTTQTFKDAGVLSIYIQTENSGNPVGNPTPRFEPGGQEIIPIPQGETASLIFSADLIGKSFLIPQFKDKHFNHHKFTDIESTVLSKGGIGINASYDVKKTVSLPENQKMGDYILSMDPVTVDFSDKPYTFEFKTDDITVSMVEVSTHATWNAYIPSTGPDDLHVPISGNVDIAVGLAKKYSWQKIGTVNDREIKIDFSVSESDYSITVKYSQSFMWMRSDEVDDIIKTHLGPLIPDITLNFDGLNFFATTNLLFPGKEVIVIDANQGIHFPHDLILLGNVNQDSAIQR
jgi:hypothetical protein